MSLPAVVPSLARFTCALSLLCTLASVACGGTNSSTVGGSSGSAVAMTGNFNGKVITVRDAASVVLPQSSTLAKSILAVAFSDTTGICEQANSTLNANTTLFLAVMVDQADGTSPPAGIYTVVDPTTANPTVEPDDVGFALVFALYKSANGYATAGSVDVTLQQSDAASGTSSGMIAASLAGVSMVSGRFEAPECDALGTFVSDMLGL